jgi:hypothetical protein
LKRELTTLWVFRRIWSSPAAVARASAQARAGTWQVAQLCLPSIERRGSKKSVLPKRAALALPERRLLVSRTSGGGQGP